MPCSLPHDEAYATPTGASYGIPPPVSRTQELTGTKRSGSVADWIARLNENPSGRRVDGPLTCHSRCARCVVTVMRAYTLTAPAVAGKE